MITLKKDRERKQHLAKVMSQTHDLLITRQVLYHSATTTTHLHCKNAFWANKRVKMFNVKDFKGKLMEKLLGARTPASSFRNLPHFRI